MATIKTYTKKPYSLAEYSMMRGVVDFTNAKQFNFFESGYSFLIVLSRPAFIEKLAEKDTEVAKLLNLFCFVLENEFKGLTGIEDITTESFEHTDGISTIASLSKTIQQSNTEITMNFTERSGAAITRFIEFYLKGCKDPRTQAKTYHGLIKDGIMTGGFENEVFNLLYIVSDNTLLGLEKAYLLANAWCNKATTSIYESEKGSIETKQIDVTFNCFVLDGDEVNKRALQFLAYINETNSVKNYTSKLFGTSQDSVAYAAVSDIKSSDKNTIKANSNDYKFSGHDLIDVSKYSTNIESKVFSTDAKTN